MKSYTDLEQSEKLAEILPIESADMYWRSLKLNGHISWTSHIKRLEPPLYDFEHYAPCWSLATLLSVLPYPSLHKTFSGWRCDSYNKEGTSYKFGESSDNPIDACYEMILKLHELKML